MLVNKIDFVCFLFCISKWYQQISLIQIHVRNMIEVSFLVIQKLPGKLYSHSHIQIIHVIGNLFLETLIYH